MTKTAIIGLGQTSVSEKWESSWRELARTAAEAALADAGTRDIDAIFVGNMLGAQLNGQLHLGALAAASAGLSGVEAVRVEAAEASGAAAVRQAVLAVRSGLVRTALVLGIEKCSDVSGNTVTSAAATVLDADYEAAQGLTLDGVAALLMRRYMHVYGLTAADFAGFSVNAHANGARNPLAMYRNRLKAERFTAAPLVADPVSLFDAAPSGDGAAAVVITGAERAADMVPQPVLIAGSALSTAPLALHERPDLLWLSAAAESAAHALTMAGVSATDIDLYELHDAYTVLATLSLEACGLAERGAGWRLAAEGALALNGRLPISTFGGLKARGNPYGATGVYQIVEAARQLRGEAGDNQVSGAALALTQNLGSLGATAVTHVLSVAE